MTRKELLEIAKPILFNTEFDADTVRAILDDEKTATRRIIKSPNYEYVFTGKTYSLVAGKQGQEYLYAECIKQSNGAAKSIKCPYRVNDILYVRETWNFVNCENCMQKEECFPKSGTSGCYTYRADCNDIKIAEMLKWRSSIHMPKEAARIFLKVTDVRVEQLQNMTASESAKEGIQLPKEYDTNERAYILKFADLWDSTIKKSDLDCYGWYANPWVWVIEFEQCKPEG